ncbi:MAG: NUDIX domain-containing protein [Candidatus Magasanikbacteria bacterium]|nr:NUDIX domain-containing protein [Candidatus Magasanikbacteria bacterium]
MISGADRPWPHGLSPGIIFLVNNMYKYTEQSDHPVPCIDAVILNEKDEILLVKRDVSPFKGFWTLVGGRVEVGDNNIEHTVLREVKEETGLDVEIKNLIDIFADPSMNPPPDPRFFVVQVAFEVKIKKGELKINPEVSDFKWLTLEKLAEHPLAFNHGLIALTYLKKKKEGQLIPSNRRIYSEYFNKDYTYIVQNEYPRFATNAIILNEKKEILLARRIQPPYVGFWDFPGGHIYVGETIEDCLKREIREELGVESEMGVLFQVYSDRAKHPKAADVVSFYFAKIKSHNFIKNVEMDDFDYFPLDDLPEKIAFHNEYPLADIKDYIYKK